MSNGIFITATGTDIGKTFISALMIKKLRENNVNAGYYKPVLSGAILKYGKLIPSDVEYVCSISGLKNNYNDLVSYVFKTPVSPHLAAQIDNIYIEKEKILNHYVKLKKLFKYIVVEGCGGLICPLRVDDKIIMLTDVIKILDLDIVIVASSEIGTINSTILTVNYAKSLKINLAGIILNNYDEANLIHIDNKEKIEMLTGIRVLTCVKKDSSNIDINIEDLKAIFI